MWLDNESQEIVDSFWKLVGEQEAFPRTLERSISLALPVALVKLPCLDLLSIEKWLLRRNVQYLFDCEIVLSVDVLSPLEEKALYLLTELIL